MRVYKWNKCGFKITIKIEVPQKIFQITDVSRNSVTRLSSDNWIDQYAYLGSFGEAYCDPKDKQTYISLFEDLDWDLYEIVRMLTIWDIINGTSTDLK